MSSDRLTNCPQAACDGTVKRLLGTGAGIIFKGSGFYETDYKRGDSYKKEAKADSGESSSSSKSDSESKSDSGSKDTSKETKTKPSTPSTSSD